MELYLYKVTLIMNNEWAIGEICANNIAEAAECIEREYGASNIQAITVMPQRSNIHEISSAFSNEDMQFFILSPELSDDESENEEDVDEDIDPDEDIDEDDSYFV